MFNQIFLLIALISAAGLSAKSFASVPPATPMHIVIDAGHGGGDHGTIYENDVVRIAEKDVTIVLAKQVARQLKLLGHRATLTRDRDQDIPLPARTALANKLGANVFVSIHMNSTQTPMATDAEGIETYILNYATDASSHRLATLENAVLGAADAYPENPDVALILKDLRLDANLAESKRLACTVQQSLVESTGPGKAPRGQRQRDRGVKQGLFYVLLGADMPSVLVEAGFLSSPRDREMVLSPRGQIQIGAAIARAIDGFGRTKGATPMQAELSRCKIN
jgi:N-acetylmuramoyl-L-alanine amidase